MGLLESLTEDNKCTQISWTETAGILRMNLNTKDRRSQNIPIANIKGEVNS
jgi:hypothetical protein